MDLRQLAALVAIADHGSFSAAARALFTVQSNVSAHISRLESELGVTLVDRSNGTVTDEGALVVDRARRVLREIDDITAELAAPGTDVAGDTRIGVIGTTARWLMPQLLTRLGSDYPDVHPVVIEGSTSALVPRVLSGEIDGALIHLPVDEPELHVEPLFAEDMLLVVPASHHLADRDVVPLRALAGEPLLLPPRSAVLRQMIDRAATAVGVTLIAQAEIDGVRLLASLAFEGFGAAIVPATATPSWLQGNFHRVTVPELPRRVVGWVQRRRPIPGPATRAAIEVCRDLVAESGPKMPGVQTRADLLSRPRT
jgi:LysR family hydrogen peroxide-inducible transcriptional activator